MIATQGRSLEAQLDRDPSEKLKPRPWLIAVPALAFFAVSVVLGQLLPVLILPLFYKIERLQQPELTQRIVGLTEGTGLSIGALLGRIGAPCKLNPNCAPSLAFGNSVFHTNL